MPGSAFSSQPQIIGAPSTGRIPNRARRSTLLRSVRLQGRSRALLGLVSVLALLTGCQDEPTVSGRPPRDAVAAPGAAYLAGQTGSSEAAGSVQSTATDTGVRAFGTLPLPVNQTYSAAGVALRINQTGTGPNGAFVITNPASTSNALLGNSNGLGNAVRGLMSGNGRAGLFEITNAGSTSNALHVTNAGLGRAVYGETSGRGGPAAEFIMSNSASLDPALQVGTAGAGQAVLATSSGNGSTVLGINYGTGPAGQFDIRNTGNADAALDANTDGSGAALRATSTSTGPAGLFRGTLRAESNNVSALSARVLTGLGFAGEFGVFSPTSGFSAIIATTYGTGPVATLQSQNASSTSEALQVSNLGSGWAVTFFSSGASGKGVLISTAGGQGLQVIGGSKNAVVGTSDGARALYTEESTEVWFTDYGFGQLANGRAFVPLDETFAETVSLDAPYHVFVQSYGDAELYVAERTATGFVVHRRGGDKHAEVSYRVVARRKGFERRRLERAPWADADPALTPRPR